MSTYNHCLSDTIIRLIEETIESEAEAARSEGEPGHAYDLGKAEALAQTLHTWKNQLETFGLLEGLGRPGAKLVKFCLDRNLP